MIIKWKVIIKSNEQIDDYKKTRSELKTVSQNYLPED